MIFLGKGPEKIRRLEEVETRAGEGGGERRRGEAGEFLHHGAEVGRVGGEHGGGRPTRRSRPLLGSSGRAGGGRPVRLDGVLARGGRGGGATRVGQQ